MTVLISTAILSTNETNENAGFLPTPAVGPLPIGRLSLAMMGSGARKAPMFGASIKRRKPMSLIRQIDIVSKSSEELRGLLGAAFITVARAEPGSIEEAEAKSLLDAIRFELSVRDFTL